MNRPLAPGLMIMMMMMMAVVVTTMVEAASVPTTNAAAAVNVTQPTPVVEITETQLEPTELKHELAFPLESVGCLSKHILLVDRDEYFFMVDRSDLLDGKNIVLRARVPRLPIKKWPFYHPLFPVHVYENSVNFLRVLGTFILDDLLPFNATHATSEHIVVQVYENEKLVNKVASFNTSNPKTGAKLLELKDLDIGNKIWISSDEKNFFYLLGSAYNVTTLTKYKVAIKKDDTDYTAILNETFTICDGDPSNSSLISITISPQDSNCNVSHSFSSALQDLGNFTGLTDQRYFYLIGDTQVYTFKVPTIGSNDSTVVHMIPMTDFFTSGSVSITSGQAAVSTVGAMVVSCLLVAMAFYGST